MNISAPSPAVTVAPSGRVTVSPAIDRPTPPPPASKFSSVVLIAFNSAAFIAGFWLFTQPGFLYFPSVIGIKILPSYKAALCDPAALGAVLFMTTVVLIIPPWP